MANKKIVSNFPQYRQAEKRINHKIVQANAMKNFYMDAHDQSHGAPLRKYFYGQSKEWEYKEKTRKNELSHVTESFLGNIPDPEYPGLYYDPAHDKITSTVHSRYGGKMIGEKNRTKFADRRKRKEQGKMKEEAEQERARQVSVDPW